MDITLLRTFLATAETGSFLGAADVVCVTQSTVSTRIKTLEDQLGVVLFERGKKGAFLTPAGHRFVPHATALVRGWEQARMDVGVSADHGFTLRVGAQVSLWDSYLVPWLVWMRRQASDIAIVAEMNNPMNLTEYLVGGSYDLIVMYRPQYRPGYVAQKIFDEEIILVSDQERVITPYSEEYFLTYWGPEFQAEHALNFPDLRIPPVSLDLGTLGIDYLLQQGGAAYFPRRSVQALIEDKLLFEVADAPVFHYPAYAMYPEGLDDRVTQMIRKGLALCAQSLGLG
ncbi:transcriptional regulator [Kordiimonas sediminis]|uniref:Transcriptional regulator n=1 Tax=Kordiimonas sediminis TaxID=1735581 RepID=A0A919AKE5_9PROT|nr:LysR family transcriptional regulator [Kordiimonas sediminis]GHF13651.1 transcriptional regulator [Kordiimonas sediminis]